MKALVKFKKGVGNMEIQDVPEPKAGAEDVKIKVKACGICGTDIRILRGEFEYATPVILGHEFTGVIVERGKRVPVEHGKIVPRYFLTLGHAVI